MVELPTEDNPVMVIEGDCAEVLKELPPDCIDAVITDPPFGIGFKYADHQDGARHRTAGTQQGYGDWLWSVLEQAEQKCKPGSPLFVWQAMLNVRNFAEWFPGREWRIFAAARSFAQIQGRLAMQHAWDPVVTWWTPGERWWAKDDAVTRDFHVASTSPRKRLAREPQWEHPCPRPLDQLRYIVRGWVRPKGIVLDCFGGSGTTAIAALKENRRCIVIEKDPTYCEIIRKRVAEAMGEGKGSLFAKQEQVSLFA